MNYRAIIHEHNGELFVRVKDGQHWVDKPISDISAVIQGLTNRGLKLGEICGLVVDTL